MHAAPLDTYRAARRVPRSVRRAIFRYALGDGLQIRVFQKANASDDDDAGSRLFQHARRRRRKPAADRGGRSRSRRMLTPISTCRACSPRSMNWSCACGAACPTTRIVQAEGRRVESLFLPRTRLRGQSQRLLRPRQQPSERRAQAPARHSRFRWRCCIWRWRSRSAFRCAACFVSGTFPAARDDAGRRRDARSDHAGSRCRSRKWWRCWSRTCSADGESVGECAAHAAAAGHARARSSRGCCAT